MSKGTMKHDLSSGLLTPTKLFVVLAISAFLLHIIARSHIHVVLPNTETSNQSPKTLAQHADLQSPANASDPSTTASHFASVSTGTRADWGPDPAKAHPFCETLRNSPIPMKGWCKRDANLRCTSGPQQGLTPFFSQVGQDVYLYTRHFQHLQRRGVYAEVATRDPVSGSNTYFMDACLGWKGVCVEANPETFQYIHRVRSCELVPTCVGALDGQRVSFLLHAESGGVEGTNKNKEEWAAGDAGRRVTMVCMSMRIVMARRAVSVVDYLSLDVEGHELEVLKGFDWETTTVNTMTIETTDESLKEIEEFLQPLGYVRHIPDLDEVSKRRGLLRRDAIFLHKDVQWGKPV